MSDEANINLAAGLGSIQELSRGGDGPADGLKVRVELGRQWISSDEVARLVPGSVVQLRCEQRSEVDVVAAGHLAARGELVEINGRLGVRVTALIAGNKNVSRQHG